MHTPPERKWDGTVVRYPDPAIEVLDSRFGKYKIGNSVVERLWTGSRWAEGPVWFGDGGYLLWSDIPNNRILKWEESTGQVSTYRKPSNYSNGHTRDRQGRLISCEHGARRVTRTEYDGTITVLMDDFDGKPLNAPNDVAVHPDGGIWFTDPGYGIMLNYEGHIAEFELPTCVYRLNPDTGEATVATDALEKPNGICFSPDYDKLYIVDTGVTHTDGTPRYIYVYDVIGGERLGKQEVFCDMLLVLLTVFDAMLMAICGRVRVGWVMVTMACMSLRLMVQLLGKSIFRDLCEPLLRACETEQVVYDGESIALFGVCGSTRCAVF